MTTHERRRKNRYLDRPPIPVGAATNPDDIAHVRDLAAGLPDTLPDLTSFLAARNAYHDFDATLHTANDALLAVVGRFRTVTDHQKRALLDYAKTYMAPSECMAVCRCLLRGPTPSIRQRCLTLLQTRQPEEITLPADKDGPWDWTGLIRGIQRGRLFQKDPSVDTLTANNLPVLQTVADLRDLLKINSTARLGYLLLATDDEDGPYTTFSVPKRSGGHRLICAPRPDLKFAQRRILSEILSRIDPHEAAHGFVPARSTVSNASAHKGRAYLIKFDLKDFFPSIHFYRVMGLFAHLGYYIEDGLFSNSDESRAIAPVLARLTTYTPDLLTWRRGYAPQGAPTSPAISNLVCRGLDARLTGLANKIGATYTRYADDLTFSLDTLPETGLGRFRWWVDQICYQEGFFINHSKFRIIRASQRQQVTGIVVNDALRVPREERRALRAILHNCRKFGVATQAKGRSGFEHWLRGYASYIHMVHPTEGARLLNEVNALFKGIP